MQKGMGQGGERTKVLKTPSQTKENLGALSPKKVQLPGQG